MNNNSSQRNVSLARALSKFGFTSRSLAEKIVLDGRVGVNGKTIIDPSYRCSLSSDLITVDKKQLQKKDFKYIIMNKPAGVITTRADERGRKTVYDLIGDIDKWIFPVGRLDKETSGLLLLTNDNRLGEFLTNPGSKISKTYLATVDKPIEDEHIKLMQAGMTMNREKLLPAQAKLLSDRDIELTIVEGKNRQIRRMFEALGYNVRTLSRSKIGNYAIKNLKEGEWKYLTRREVELLKGKNAFGSSEESQK